MRRPFRFINRIIRLFELNFLRPDSRMASETAVGA